VSTVICHAVNSHAMQFIFQACTFDHVEVNFYHNGKHLHCPLTGIRETVYPVIYGKNF